MNPPANCVIEDRALEVGGITRADLATFGTQDELYEKFLMWVLPYRNKMGKLTIAGWNADFDKPFVEAFFNRVAGGSSFSQVFYHYTISPYAFARILLLEDAFKGRYGDRPLNLKLGSLAKWLKIDTSDFQLHSALSDAILAKQVYEI
jgi:DNA polymerase III epsilon subunit-like protein